MGTMIEVKPETAKQLHSLAAGKGVSVDDLLRVYVPGLTTNGNIASGQADKIDSFIEWAKNHPTTAPLLSDEAVSRKSFYER